MLYVLMLDNDLIMAYRNRHEAEAARDEWQEGVARGYSGQPVAHYWVTPVQLKEDDDEQD